MRHFFLFLSLVIVNAYSYAQNFTNGSFENWTKPVGSSAEFPNNWETLDQANFAAFGTNFINLVSKDSTSANVSDGKYSCRIKSDSVANPNGIGKTFVKGYISSGNIKTDSTNGTVTQSFVSYKFRPDFIEFSYKYIPAIFGQDSAWASLELKTAANTSLLSGYILLTQKDTMTKVSYYLKSLYSSNDIPDSMLLTFSSSTFSYPGPQQVGSALWIDGLNFIQPKPCSAYFNILPDTVPSHWFAYNQATGAQPLSYVWNWGDGDTSIGATPSHTFTAPDYYNICLSITDANGCQATFCDSSNYIYKTDVAPISIDVIKNGVSSVDKELAPNSSIFVSPNPASINLIVELENFSSAKEFSFTVTSIEGKKIKSSKINSAKTSIDILDWSKGIYFLTVLNKNGESWSRKFIKD